MIPIMRNPAVNWQDGMKVSKRHFRETEDFVIDRIRDLACLSSSALGYGLIPTNKSGSGSLDLRIEKVTADKTKFIVTCCRALTPNGTRIEFAPSGDSEKSLSEYRIEHIVEHADTERLSIFIVTPPNKQALGGVPDPEEQPPRLPYAFPAVELRVASSRDNYFDPYGIKIGELYFEDGKPVLSKSFIPPCTSVFAFPRLLEFYSHKNEMLLELWHNATQVMRNATQIFQRSGEEDRLLVYNVNMFADKLSLFLASSLDHYRLVLPHCQTVFFFQYFVRLARMVSTYFAGLAEGEYGRLKEYLLYFVMTEEGMSKFTNALDQLLQVDFDPNQLSNLLALVDRFFEPLCEVFGKLSEADFIGKKPGIR